MKSRSGLYGDTGDTVAPEVITWDRKNGNPPNGRPEERSPAPIHRSEKDSRRPYGPADATPGTADADCLTTDDDSDGDGDGTGTVHTDAGRMQGNSKRCKGGLNDNGTAVERHDRHRGGP
ncbi:hypothetical protein GCM10018779_53220 [Streptomyces griseocarneus]|nr:hypothetical protein GCM10018779_53220 [Streptomyces griseocarneus]